MTQERIDLTKIETFLESAGQESGGRFVYDLIAELKRCYERLDVYREELEYQLQTAEQCGWTETIERLHSILNASE